ncbi:MFS transporter [Candidatus Xianfuyuplasma coldseepsis]|uniref:MFS transporter n=1 Tax=Candidatus Xianfuyuplasma coldseepsis TaxID=2782163 RepID=A0A7L7KS37_9MOLU|nr:MFS transporter [Xianfuyuplasma coldseepsis]QMS85006.1 MFS transporter [Xianfuyuplasma coldseepsis]
MFKLPHLSKKERAWVLYDVANSAFILTVITIFFPILYQMVYMNGQGVAEEAANYQEVWTRGSQIFKYLTSALALTVAILSPIVGSWSNYHGNKKKFFKLFLGVAMVGGVGLAIPTLGWVTLLVIFFITSMNYNLTNVLYDAFLVDVTTEDRMDEVSATGYGWGYIGSLIPFFIGIIPYALVLFGVIKVGFLGMDSYMLERVTIGIAFVVSIVWWLIYSLPLLREVDQTYNLEHTGNNLGESLKRLAKTFKEIRTYRYIFMFLIAYLLYIDVVNSVIRLATNIGGDLGVEAMTMLGVVVMVQVIAFPSAIVYGRMTKRFGTKNMIFYGIGVYAIGVITVFFIREDTTWMMWIVGALIGTAQGGIQSISRSYFAKMVPKEKANDFFGFFSVFGRFAGIFSPFIIAFFQAPDRLGINGAVLVLLVPLALATILLVFVKDQKVEYVG